MNRKIALENSPTVRSLDWIRDAPITTSTMLASDGITSSSALEPAADADGLQARRPHLLGQAGETLGLALLGTVRLDELHTFEALVDAGRELAELILGAA